MFQKLHAHFPFRLMNKWFEFNKASKYNVLLVHSVITGTLCYGRIIDFYILHHAKVFFSHYESVLPLNLKKSRGWC